MSERCPLLIRAAFVGRTYHDFRLKFESPTENCTVDHQQKPFLIEFTRLVNETLNRTSYVLYKMFDENEENPGIQVAHQQRVNFCIKPTIETDRFQSQCHEFYMITMCRFSDNYFWPLLLTSLYIILFFVALAFCFPNRSWMKIYHSSMFVYLHSTFQRLVYGSIDAENLRKKENFDAKRQIIRSISTIAKQERFLRRKTIPVVDPMIVDGEDNVTFYAT